MTKAKLPIDLSSANSAGFKGNRHMGQVGWSAPAPSCSRSGSPATTYVVRNNNYWGSHKGVPR